MAVERAELEVALSNLSAQISQRVRAEARLRESEERYRLLVELSPDAVLVVGGGKLLYVNAAGVRMFGAQSAQALNGVPLQALLRLDDPGRMSRLDGTLIEVEVSSARINFDGQPADQLLIRDVGERRAVERIKDELLSIVSHELRTPLTSVRASLGLLAAGVVGELPWRATRLLDIAVENSDRLIRLLNDVLDLERLRAGRLSLQIDAHRASDLAERSVAQMAALADEAGVQLRIGELEGVVAADADRIIQVLTNLLSNAIKFSAPGSAVQVEARVLDEVVRFRVIDEGRGIPAEHLETIFDRFRQVDASDARRNGGTGLGLAISRSIVEQHDGRLWAESVLGEGSTFYVELRSPDA